MSAKRRPAARPRPRTVEIALPADSSYAGWSATVSLNFPAKLVGELQSGDVPRILGALERLILEHNFPDEEGELATSLADVDMYGLIAIAEAISDAIASLPNR